MASIETSWVDIISLIFFMQPQSCSFISKLPNQWFISWLHILTINCLVLYFLDLMSIPWSADQVHNIGSDPIVIGLFLECGPEPLAIDLFSQKGVTLAASREPAGKWWQLCKVLHVFEQKTQYLLIHAQFTCIVIFWHIGKVPPQWFCRVKLAVIPPHFV